MTGSSPPYDAAPPRGARRPSAWWFAVGGALVVLAATAGAILFVWTLSGFLDADARVPADGTSHTVALDGDERRMLWTEDGLEQSCQVVQDDGREVTQRPVTGSFTRSEDGRDWTGASTFDVGSDSVVSVTCTGGGKVVIGPAPAVDSFVLGLLATIFVPLLLGGSGLVVLIVTGVLFAIRPRRGPRRNNM